MPLAVTGTVTVTVTVTRDSNRDALARPRRRPGQPRPGTAAPAARHQQIGVRLFLIIFICIDYTPYIKIICDYILIIPMFFLQNFNDYTRLMHYLQNDDYFTYFTTIIPLIVFGIYYCYYLYCITKMRIIGIIAIVFLYPHLHIKVVYGFRFWV